MRSFLLLFLLSSTLTIDQRLAKWKPVTMPAPANLSVRESRMVGKLVQASKLLDQAHWRQIDPAGYHLYQTTADPKLKRLLSINGSRFDLIDENRPFAGTTSMPPGRAFYPEDLTRAEIERYVKQHPNQKDALYSPYTVVRRKGKFLEAIPYHTAFKDLVDPMAQALRDAAALSGDPAFANFLRLRAAAMQSDDYYASDLAWVDLKDPKFDLIFAPYETHMDELLGIKGSYGASVLVCNDAESAKLRIFQKYVPDIQDALPLPAADRPSKRGHATPMEVCDAPFRAGDLYHGYQAVADNLPNDPRIHQEKGTKKIFFKNFLDARVKYVIVPVAQRIMDTTQARQVTGDAVMAGVLMHEIAHGIGPAFARRDGKQTDIRESLGTLASALEEANADVVGMHGLQWLMDHGVLPKARATEYYASYLAHMFRSVRFGVAEAHGRAEMTEFNFLVQEKAIAQDAADRFRVEMQRIAPALAKIAKELLEIEATGDRARAENWFAKYDKMPSELTKALASTTDIPVDVAPTFAY